MLPLFAMARLWCSRLAEVEAYVDIAISYAVIITLCLLALAIVLPEMWPR
jgi:hypothetical protein